MESLPSKFGVPPPVQMSRCSCICWPMVVLLLAVHSARGLRPTRQVPMAGGGATGGGIFWMAADPNAPNDLQMWPSAGGFGTAQQQQPQQMLMGQQPQQQMDWPSFSGYGQMTGAGGASVGQPGAQGMPASPYAAYLEKQIASYPVMIYTLADCIPCQRAKHLLATHYPDVRAHYLELSGNEPWQQQLQIDLQYLTGAITFPYIFVCGQYIGGASELFELHESGQLRRMVAQCLKPVPK